ncbi:hypothetical protein G7059_03610 [Erysipelothrix sp. HDW6A]|uniref:hypothetical protein n=1 Tax=Erysipelothrix sp. HDW6A TaxID=2714928 RepID=UPI00140E2FC4|nr:hypothetical protein [Erysipelothrix sp. HDW6A]QIK56998.1 hypothetical protein G7059_03610 [Erysipelothrix sp. HDW6A]
MNRIILTILIVLCFIAYLLKDSNLQIFLLSVLIATSVSQLGSEIEEGKKQS